ncbi:MAG: LL-diaminopimelate aminotransferase [Candidatus Firestonebacteria bacterium]
MKHNFSKRLDCLPPYLFIEIDKMKKKALAEGKNLIDLGIGDPDLPTPKPIIEELKKTCEDAKYHRYPLGTGLIQFREAVANWYKRRFDVELEPKSEVVTLIGSKEGIGHIPLAFVNPGDVVLVPNPGYPVYNASTVFAGGKPFMMPITEKNNWVPDLNSIPKNLLKKTKLMFLNYPNNPTSAVATREFFEEVVRFAKKHNIIVCHDAAYSEIYFGNEKPLSFLQVNGAKDVGIEFHSLSKTFNMTGWRIGFAVGNKEIVRGLAKVKENLDSGVFEAIQMAGIKALNLPDANTENIRKEYEKRRNILLTGLKEIGLEVGETKATFYVWIKVPQVYKKTKSPSSEFVAFLLQQCGIISTPGVGFGKYGEGYIRMTLCASSAKLEEAIFRMKQNL